MNEEVDEQAHLALHAIFQLGKYSKAIDGRDACAFDNASQPIGSAPPAPHLLM